jgi:hypothetical protein
VYDAGMRHRELLNVALVVFIVGCSGASTSSPPPGPPTAGEPATPTETTPPAPDTTGTANPAGGTLLADGEPCFDSASCNSGVCEGQGCTQAEPDLLREGSRVHAGLARILRVRRSDIQDLGILPGASIREHGGVLRWCSMICVTLEDLPHGRF